MSPGEDNGMNSTPEAKSGHIRLTSHPGSRGPVRFPLHWGAASAAERGPVTKIAVDPVWWLPGVAERFGVGEGALRRCLFEQTGGMYPELVTRPDLSVFLPPIGGMTLYIFGDPEALGQKKLTCRVHDEC